MGKNGRVEPHGQRVMLVLARQIKMRQAGSWLGPSEGEGLVLDVVSGLWKMQWGSSDGYPSHAKWEGGSRWMFSDET